ncbi:hypothetical protein DBR43_18880 [Pedobacter sp. KBW06]|uniref:hypothetical protein n=1 Tax=Pedobacter sp. KBW06 TaxID=2153359 RepID=UPI000F5AA940|nr:hypothetical protein [Pedobacter sp. KBW06]RQO70104.1 hypothetical protein DBR43_18880 [Pedobacter sp. KBW06]
MKIQIVNILLFSSLALCFSCKKEVDPQTNKGFEKRNLKASYAAAALLPVQTVSGSITTNTTWDNSKVWEINGVLVVKNGATLTIQPGTYIKSTVNNSLYPNGVIVIQKGAKISAIGTVDQPIVFTSRYKLGDNRKSADPGDFGGIILLGNAPVNVGSKYIEGLPGKDFSFGGLDTMDNSGSIQYARIEYAGFILAADNEVNSLTCGGVGRGTTLEHIEASYGLDDSFEFFGGTVNASYLISKAPQDDNFDFDNGYRGEIAYSLALADKNSLHSRSGGNSDSHGIESDNNGVLEDPAFGLMPKTHPILSSLSIIGTSTFFYSSFGNGAYRYGIRNRRGAELELYDSIIVGYPSGLVFNDGTEASYAYGPSILEGNYFHGFNAAITPAGSYVNNTQSTSVTAPAYGMTQPFFNDGPLSFENAFYGAFSQSPYWASGWSTL